MTKRQFRTILAASYDNPNYDTSGIIIERQDALSQASAVLALEGHGVLHHDWIMGGSVTGESYHSPNCRACAASAWAKEIVKEEG